MKTNFQKSIRHTLAVLLAFMALNAFGGGIYGLSGADGIPPEWLEGSPFGSYIIPSLFLLVVLGGSCLTASVLLFRNARSARLSALCCGILMVLWIVVQMLIIGYVSWMQPAVLSAGAVTIPAALALKRK